MDGKPLQKLGTSVLKGVVEALKTIQLKTIEGYGLFVFAGLILSLLEFSRLFELNQSGNISTDSLTQTNIEEVHGVGEIASRPRRQTATAASGETVAVIAVPKDLGSV